jgi:two-component system sensor histidine kinase KdpD
VRDDRPRKVLLAALTIGVLSAGARLADLNEPTAGFLYLLAVLFLAMWGGLVVGAVASLLATACYNVFFFPPLYTFTIADPSNWVALTTFLVTSVVVSRLVVRAREQAQRAEQRQREVEELAAERQRFVEESAHLQALRESDELKTSLLRAVSHDLQTPLTAIALHTEALRREAAGRAELGETAEAIADETARLRRRVDNLLTMARLDAGRAVPRPEPTSPADLFRAACESLPLVSAHREVTVQVDDDCPDAQVDPSLALEVLVNLVENAHRAAPAETAIELVAGRHPADSTKVRLEVRDRGPGLPAPARERERGGAPAVPSPPFDGATGDVSHRGLGLEIARSLAKASAGEVELVQRPGGGTVARLDLQAASLPTEEAS